MAMDEQEMFYRGISNHTGTQAASVIQVESNKLVGVFVVVALLAIGVAFLALGLSIGARDTAKQSERESRLQRLEVDEMKVALQIQGIKTHEGSSP